METSEMMRADVLDQPEAIRQSLPSLRAQIADLSWPVGTFRRVIFAGSGDSYFAPKALEYAARKHVSLPVRALPSLEAARYWPFQEGDLLVALSISGESMRTTWAAKAASEAGAFALGVTVNEASSLAAASKAKLIIPFKSRSRSTPHAADYMATLISVAVILEHLGGTQFAVLDNLAGMVGEALAALDGPCQTLAHAVVSDVAFHFLGTGPSLATAEYGMAKFWEAGGFRAFALDLEEYGHGLHLSVGEDDTVFVMAPSGQALDRAVAVVKGNQVLGPHVVAVTDAPERFGSERVLPFPKVAEEWSPLVSCLPLQLACWAIASLKGFGHRHGAETYQEAHRFLRT